MTDAKQHAEKLTLIADMTLNGPTTVDANDEPALRTGAACIEACERILAIGGEIHLTDTRWYRIAREALRGESK